MITWPLSSEVLEWMSDHSYLIISLQPNLFLAAMLLRSVLPQSGESLLCSSFTVFNYRIVLWKLEGKTCLEALGHPQEVKRGGSPAIAPPIPAFKGAKPEKRRPGHIEGLA